MPLGSGVNTAVIYDAAGERRLFEVPGQAGVEWTRVLGEVSEAHVTAVPPEGHGRADCCALLGRIFPWAHCLVIFRDDVRVWEGPVVKVTVSGTSVVVDAVDVVGWLRRRPVSARQSTATVSVLDEGELCLTRGFAEHDPNVLAHVVVVPWGDAAMITRDVGAGSAYYADDLGDLVGSGLRFTVLGRSVILWNHSWLLGQLTALHPARDLVDEVTFARDGMALATRVVARNDDNETGMSPVSPGDGVDIDYGLVSQLTESSTVKGITALEGIAAATRSQAFPLPTVMVMPDGATLNCDANYDITQLVPGMMVPVFEDGLCWDIRQQMMLTTVEVTQSADAGETVGVTLVPLAGVQADEANTVSDTEDDGVTLAITDSSGREWTLISDDGHTAVYHSTVEVT